MHNLGPSSLEQTQMYEGPYGYAGEMPGGPYEGPYNESPLDEILGEAGEFNESGELYEAGEINDSGELYEAGEVMDSGELYEAGELYEQGEFLGETDNEEEEIVSLATELLEIQDEGQLDQFLGKLVRRASRGVRGFMRSQLGRTLGNALRQVARRALPIAGKALGTMVGGPVGGMIGGQLSSMAGQALGLELGGLSPQDANYAAAQQFVRFATDAVRNASQAGRQMPPQQAVRTAVQQSASRFAPGLLNANANRIRPQVRRGRRGVWVRRGRTITLFGV